MAVQGNGQTSALPIAVTAGAAVTGITGVLDYISLDGVTGYIAAQPGCLAGRSTTFGPYLDATSRIFAAFPSSTNVRFWVR